MTIISLGNRLIESDLWEPPLIDQRGFVILVGGDLDGGDDVGE